MKFCMPGDLLLINVPFTYLWDDADIFKSRTTNVVNKSDNPIFVISSNMKEPIAEEICMCYIVTSTMKFGWISGAYLNAYLNQL